MFEDNFQWNGLLIEANPDNYLKLIKNRKFTKNIHLGVCRKNQTTIKFGGSHAVGGDISE